MKSQSVLNGVAFKEQPLFGNAELDQWNTLVANGQFTEAAKFISIGNFTQDEGFNTSKIDSLFRPHMEVCHDEKFFDIWLTQRRLKGYLPMDKGNLAELEIVITERSLTGLGIVAKSLGEYIQETAVEGMTNRLSMKVLKEGHKGQDRAWVNFIEQGMEQSERWTKSIFSLLLRKTFEVGLMSTSMGWKGLPSFLAKIHQLGNQQFPGLFCNDLASEAEDGYIKQTSRSSQYGQHVRNVFAEIEKLQNQKLLDASLTRPGIEPRMSI